MPRNFDHKMSILEVEDFDKSLNCGQSPTYFHRHGLLHHLSRISLHQPTKVYYRSFPKDCHCKGCNNHIDELQHPVMCEAKVQSRNNVNGRAGSKLYHKILKWKNSLRKFRLSSKKATLSSNSARMTCDSLPVSKRKFPLRFSSKCTNEKVKTRLLEKSSSMSIHDNIPFSLTSVLHCKESVKRFRNFLTTERSEENLDFWFDVQYFKNNPRIEEAARICSTYVGEEAPKEVNLSYRVKKQINEDLKDEHSLKHIFDDAEVEIFQLMQKDSFVRFKASSA